MYLRQVDKEKTGMPAFCDAGIAFQISWESKSWSKADEHEVSKGKKKKFDGFNGSSQVPVEKPSTAWCFGMSLEEVKKCCSLCLAQKDRVG